MAREYNKRTPQKLEIDYAGKIPPFSEDLEETVLGQLMLEDDAILQVIEDLKPETFYNKKHQTIFEAIHKISANQDPVNIQTVVEQLRRDENLDSVGGAYFVAQLTQKVSSAAHIGHHAKLLAQKFIQRELIRVSAQIQEKAFDPAVEVDELVDFSETEIFKVSEGNIKKAALPINLVMEQVFENIKKAQENKNKYSGQPSGFTDLDAITSGWQAGSMVVIAARPAMGKTAFVLSMLRNMAIDFQVPVAMFSLEMSNAQLVNRLVVGESEIPHDKLKTGDLTADDWSTLYSRTKSLGSAPIFLDDTPALSIMEFRAKCRRLYEKEKIQCVFLDYLQLMTTNNPANRQEEVSMISRQIKAVAMELNIPIIALSQLSRAVETRGGNKRPQLSDLRESGAIEQDADMVLFIHRPEYYGQTEDEEGNSTEGLAEIIIAKNRHGSVDDVNLTFIPKLTKFTDRNPANTFALNGALPPVSNFDTALSSGMGTFETQTYSSKMNQTATSEFDTTIETAPPF
ncbi:MAG: replicative DNA helicase [Bacteroidales bacterium]|jgi:replicative DNA helicase|nr:replicative DNA helicase [Bacteroidales bacterium]